MEKYIYDNSNGLWYELQGDCLIFQNSFKLGARMMLEVMDE